MTHFSTTHIKNTLPPITSPPVPMPVTMPPPTTFLLSLLLHGADKLLDLSTKDGMKYWEKATKSLYDETKFDAVPEMFCTFIDLLNDRCKDLWMLEPGSNLHITSLKKKATPIDLNLIQEYGRISYDEMYEW